MSIFAAGTLIRQLRTAQGMTQARLAEGICSRQTITMIERGERNPDWFTFKNIMMRLGEDPQKIGGGVVSDDDKHIIDTLKKVDCLAAVSDYEAIDALLSEMENDKRFASMRGGHPSARMAYLDIKAISCNNQKRPRPKEAVDCLLEILRISRPGFDVDKINEYFLSDSEITCINKLAIAYRTLYGLDKMIEVLLKLKANFEKDYKVGVWSDINYRMIVSNTAHAMWLAGRFEECLPIAEEGLENAIQHTDMRRFHKFLAAKAISLMKLGRVDEGKECFKRLVLFFYATGESVGAREAKEEYEKLFGNALDLMVEW